MLRQRIACGKAVGDLIIPGGDGAVDFETAKHHNAIGLMVDKLVCSGLALRGSSASGYAALPVG